MQGWIIDAYRSGKKLIIWVKTPEEDLRIEHEPEIIIYIEQHKKTFDFLTKYSLPFKIVKKKNYLSQELEVVAVKIPNISKFERFVRAVEKETKHSVSLYNADIAPEQMYFYKNNLNPFDMVDFENGKITKSKENKSVALSKILIFFNKTPIEKMAVDGQEIAGDEKKC